MRYRMNYDNVFLSALSVVVISLQEGWPDDMHRNMDIVNIGFQPIRDSSEQYAIFNVVTIFLGNWFFISVLQGVIIDNLKQKKDEVQGFNLLTEKQKSWMNWLTTLLSSRPKTQPITPRSWLHQTCQIIALSITFHRFMLGVVLTNTVVMACNHAHASDRFQTIERSTEIIFTLIYILEAIILVRGVGMRVYLADNWNILSAIIISFACIAIGLDAFGSGPGFVLRANVFFPARLLRIVRVVEFMPGVIALARTVILTFSQLVNVMFLMFLSYYIFAIIGMFYFGKINAVATQNFTNHINFEDFPTAMLCVYVMSTGENWPGIMNDLMMDGFPLCDHALDNCGQPWAPVYALGIQFLIGLTLVSTFIAIVVDTFHDMLAQHDQITIKDDNVDYFCALWTQFDPDHTWWIEFPRIVELMARMYSHMKTISDRSDFISLKQTLGDVLVHNNYIYFPDVLCALFYAQVGGTELPPLLEVQMRKQGVRRNSFYHRTNEALTFSTVHAIVTLQRKFRLKTQNTTTKKT
jgi:hypothetical protein